MQSLNDLLKLVTSVLLFPLFCGSRHFTVTVSVFAGCFTSRISEVVQSVAHFSVGVFFVRDYLVFNLPVRYITLKSSSTVKG